MVSVGSDCGVGRALGRIVSHQGRLRAHLRAGARVRDHIRRSRRDGASDSSRRDLGSYPLSGSGKDRLPRRQGTCDRGSAVGVAQIRRERADTVRTPRALTRHGNPRSHHRTTQFLCARYALGSVAVCSGNRQAECLHHVLDGGRIFGPDVSGLRRPPYHCQRW